jgi:COP9 signalosome complex subunit 3
MEAMKKLSLVQLIRHGQLKALPKYVPQSFAKGIKQSAYGALAKVYPAGPVQQVAEKEQKTFRSDYNLGLLMQVVNTAPRWKLRTLTKTYLTLSIEEISKEIGMPNLNALRELVRNMVSNLYSLLSTGDPDVLNKYRSTSERLPLHWRRTR